MFRGSNARATRPECRPWVPDDVSPLGERDFAAYISAMFGELLKRLVIPDPAPLPDTDARLALTALMVRIARTDGDYAPEEVHRIDCILLTRYELSPDDVTKLRHQAETLEAEAPDTVRFTRAIKDAVPYEERQSVVQALWEVALADGSRDHEEGALLRLLANLLGVNDRDSNMIRQRVENNT